MQQCQTRIFLLERVLAVSFSAQHFARAIFRDVIYDFKGSVSAGNISVVMGNQPQTTGRYQVRATRVHAVVATAS